MNNGATTYSSWPVFCFFLGTGQCCARPITWQVTLVTCPIIGGGKSELIPTQRQKMGPGQI